MVKALADPGPPPLDPKGLAGLRRLAADGTHLPGLVMVGSHVPLADQQLELLLVEAGCQGVELPVPRIARVLEGPTPDLLLADLERVWLQQLRALLDQGLTPVLFTSRGELRCASEHEGRRLSSALAELMGRLAAALASDLGYLISKGGITSQTLLARGLALESVQLEGQLVPGLSLVRPSAGPCSGLPILTFPGNLGVAGTLREAWQRMEAG